MNAASSVRDDLSTLVVGSMCHCDDPDDCYDHWQFYFDAEMGRDGEHVARGRTLEKRHLDALAELARAWVAASAPEKYEDGES